MKLFFLMFIVLFTMAIEAQDFSKDSLKNKSDKELLTLFNEVRVDSIRAEKVIRFYLDRARKEKDTLKMAESYYKLAFVSKSEKWLIFADSIIFLTKNLNNNIFPAKGYYLKSIYYNYYNGDLNLTIKNILKAYSLAQKNKNIVQQLNYSNTLIGFKSNWGNKHDALKLQKKRHQLLISKKFIVNFENEYSGYLISSIQNFTLCYISLNALDSASIYLKKGFEMNNKQKDIYYDYFYNWFTIASIEINYRLNNYKKANVISTKLLNTIDLSKLVDHAMLLDVYYFKGLSLIKLGKYNEGINYFKKGDSLFEQKNFLLLPYHRGLFKELLVYYRKKNNTKMEVIYLNKLITIDSIFKKNYQYFEPNLIKNYETPQLIEKKEEVITELKQKNKKTSVKIWWMFAFLTISLLTILYYFKRQQLYKKRFDNLILQQEISKLKDIEVVSELENVESTLITNNEVSFEIEKDILNHLKHFETENGYLSQGVSLHNLSKTFGTNRIYLSKVIKLRRGEKFTTYINNLRIEYSFRELKINPELRKYTIKAIAKECGFSSAESFSKKFYKKYGIYPSYYIKNLV